MRMGGWVNTVMREGIQRGRVKTKGHLKSPMWRPNTVEVFQNKYIYDRDPNEITE